MSNDRQLNYVNNLQNRDQKLYYVDDASELNSINLGENDKIYAINDNKLFQMEIADQEEELSGSIVSFNGRNNTKIKSLVTNIEPQQDLHGYDHPWPAGGGKNKIEFPYRDSTTTINGVTFTVDSDGSVKLSGTASATATFYLKSGSIDASQYNGMIINGVTGGSASTYFLRISDVGSKSVDQSNGDVTISGLSNTGSFNLYIRVVSGHSFSSPVTVYPMIRLSSVSDATFAPYSNICPISGWTGAEIEQRGKNLINPDFSALSVGKNYSYINNVIPDGQIARFTFVDKDTSISLEGISIGFTDDDLSKVKGVNEYRWAMQNGTVSANTSNISTRSNIICSNVFIYPNTQEAFEKIFARFDIMVELGSTATDYEPYTGNQISVTFPDEAGTVYGGKITLNPDRTGTLAVTLKEVDMGSLNWCYQASNTCFYCDPENKKSGECIVITPITKPAVSAYTVPDYCMATSNAAPLRIFTSFPEYTTVAAFKAAMTGLPLIYELAEPQTFQLTAEQVSGILTTLYGQNNIWANTGDITVKIAEKGITAFELKPHI